MFFFYIILLYITLTKAFKDGPNITMFHERINYNSRYTCVASGDETISKAQTFITAISTENTGISDFVIKNGNIEDYNCDFEGKSLCHYGWTRKSTNSKKYRLHPVLDDRWNKFDLFRTKGLNEKHKLTINEFNFHFSISIRGKEDAQILLCDGRTISSGCYWILIDAFTMYDLTVIRKCKDGIPEKFPKSGTECAAKKDTIDEPRKLLSENKWSHFTITRENNNRILFWESSQTDKPILNYTDHESPINIRSIFFRSYKETIIEWKVHDYKFLDLTDMYENDQYSIGPNIDLSKITEPCFSMYVALCAQCTMEISFEISDQGFTLTEVIQGTQELFYIWKQIRFRPLLQHSYNKGKFYVKISTKEETVDSPFWLLDDFRLCSSNDIKVGSIQTKSDVSCEPLQYPEWHFSIINNNNLTTNTETLHCPNPQYTGKYCDIDCSRIFKTEPYCEKKKICIPSKNSNSICICASGYKGIDCSAECPEEFYGYNCNKKCGKCWYNRVCSKKSGQCNHCHEDFVAPYCNTTYFPRLLEAPTIVNTGYNSIKVQLNNITAEGLEEPTHFQIEYKKEYDGYWNAYNEKELLTLRKEIDIINLEKETFYLIRAVLFTKNGSSYKSDDNDEDFGIPQVKSRTLCDDITMDIKPSSKNVTITLIETRSTCNKYNYNISLVANGTFLESYDNLRQINVFRKLVPYKSYEVILNYKFEPFNQIQKEFTTLQEAPSYVINVKYEIISDTEVSLTWGPPLIANGLITEYIIQFKHVKYISCTTNTFEVEKEIIVPSNNSQHPQVVLDKLKPFSYYIASIAAKTVKIGDFVTLTFTTKSSEISNEELPLISSIKTIPSSTSVRVDWDLPNCENIRGSLVYEISITCIKSEWCNKFVSQQNTGYASSKTFQFSNLIPFTFYKMELKGFRYDFKNITTDVITKYFDTPAGSPTEVRNLSIYSSDANSLSIRWLPPYPPNGKLEHYLSNNCNYKIRYYYTHPCTLPSEPSKIITIPCNLWEENFICFTLKYPTSDTSYKIGIASKNKDVRQLSPLSILYGKVTENVPTEPLNLNKNWENNILTLYWNHPFFPNGPIKYFKIILSQIATDIQEINEKIYHQFLNVTTPMKTYSKELEKTFQYSSSYNVTVQAFTEKEGKPATLIIHTPPETPKFSEEVKLIENTITNMTVKIEVPPVEKTTRSKESFMYIVVNELNSKVKRDAQIQLYSTDLEKIILDDCSVPGAKHSWIAYELMFQEIKVDIEIGNGTTINSSKLNKTINNYHLKPETEYEICVLLMNEYRTERSTKLYKVSSVRTTATIIPSSGPLFALLLLLTIPVIIFYVYRRYTNKNRNTSPGIRMPILNVSASRQGQENHPDPDIIPLTKETSDSNLSRNDTAPTAANSKINASAEITPSATINFHSRLVPLNKYEKYLKEAIESGELAEQHSLFPRGQTKPWNYGMLKENKFKNRYNNLIAYDKNRVKLEKISKDYYSDYINASYIHGYKQENAYIATQGPKLTTVNDFWRMIWQENVQYIVMLANIVEGGKRKCEKYWPEIDSPREYGMIDVNFKRNEIFADFEYRTFIITHNDEERTVIQLHFTSWPDHGVPLYPQSLVPFLKKILTIPQSTAPIVVHCSAGVGRTGTIILCDICLRMAAREGQVDVLKYLHEIREQRANMVDNVDQYKLVHLVLLECLLAPDTNIPCNSNFSTTVQTMIEDGCLQIQLNNLQKTSWQDKALNFASTIKHNPLNDSKNRFPDIVPETNQIYLTRYPVTDETSDYINAIPVDGFRFKEQFIVTQTPKPNTVGDFWRMVAEKSIKIIVSLNNIPADDPTCCVFWPTKDEDVQLTSRFQLKYSKSQAIHNNNIYNISFIDNESEEQSPRLIQIIQFKDWNYDCLVPNNIENLVTLLEETENLSRGNYPMVVSCYDGATASGLFVATSFVIEKIKLEQQCDPCLAVRVVRRNRKQFIKNKAQFECLYKSAIIYLNMFDTYSNFEPTPKN